MSEYRQTALVFVSTLAISALGITLAAQAQTIPSPFAKKGKQAWESGDTNTTQQPYQYPYGSGSTAPSNPAPTTTSSPYATTTPSAPSPSYTYSSGGSPTPTVTSTSSSPSPTSSYSYKMPSPRTSGSPSYSGGSGTYVPATNDMTSGGSPYPSTYSGGSGVYNPPAQRQPSYQQPTGPAQAGATYDYPSYNRAPSTGRTTGSTSGAYYPGRTNGGQQTGAQQQSYPQQQQGGRGVYYPQQAQTSYPTPGPYGTPQKPKRSTGDKFGLNNIDFYYEGYVAGGAAGTYFDDLSVTDEEWREDFVLDGKGLVEVSAITQGGLEYGVAAELRGQYDPYRRGFGGRVGDCPPDEAGCSGIEIDNEDFVLRGHTSRFYASGLDDAKDFQAQLEGAHIFLRSAYGDVTVGRDDGAAYLFSLGAPSLLNVGASNSPVDYTGLDAVKTVNDASGFSEKITYTSPRLLGDTVGVGIQLGASYAPNAKACGVDYCVRDAEDEPVGVLAPDVEDIFELGLALDRKFDNGLSVEATGNYATGSQKSPIAAFDDLKSYGLALELGYGEFVLGGSYLKSNNALIDGDYEAYDVGLTWQPSKLGLTVGYGHATDDNVGLTSDQAVAGVSYDLNDMFRVSTGVQYVIRDVNVFNNVTDLVSPENEKATSVFVEGRVKF